MKNKQILLKLLSGIGFLTSAVFTYNLNAEMSFNLIEKIIAGAMTLVMQAGSFYFFIRTLREKTKNKFFFGLLAILLFSLSIVATISYQVARENKLVNDNKFNSVEYTQATENRNIAIDNRKLIITEITNIRNDIKETKELYSNQINSLLDEKKKTPAWRKEQIDSQIAVKQKQMNTILENKNKSLESAITRSQDTTKFNIGVIIEKLDDKGNLGLAARIEEIFGWNKEKVALSISVIFAIIFELTAIGLHIASIENTRVAKQSENSSRKTKVVELKDNPKFSQAQLNLYCKELFSCTGDIASGYKKISEKCGLKEGVGKNIFQYLKDTNIVKVVNGETRILDRKQVV